MSKKDSGKPNASAGGRLSIAEGLNVNRLGFGAMRITGAGVWGEPKDPAEARRVLRRAVELGVDFIDTADSYGPEVSERLIAEALHPYPQGLVIATKGGLARSGPGAWHPLGRPEYLTQCVEMSLRRLKLDYIELYQLHRIDPKVPVEESLGALSDLQKAGKIRHIGLSEVSLAEIKRAKKTVAIVSVQNRYNLADRSADAIVRLLREGEPRFHPLVPRCRRGPGTPGRSPRPGGRKARSLRRPNRDRLAVASLEGHSADPGHLLGRASGGKRGRGLAQAE